MATLSIKKLDNTDHVRLTYGTFTFDNSYPTGGESIDLGLNLVYSAIFEPTSGFIFKYDSVNKKVLAYYADYTAVGAGALIELPNTDASLNNIVVRFLAVGE